MKKILSIAGFILGVITINAQAAPDTKTDANAANRSRQIPPSAPFPTQRGTDDELRVNQRLGAQRELDLRRTYAVTNLPPGSVDTNFTTRFPRPTNGEASLLTNRARRAIAERAAGVGGSPEGRRVPFNTNRITNLPANQQLATNRSRVAYSNLPPVVRALTNAPARTQPSVSGTNQGARFKSVTSDLLTTQPAPQNPVPAPTATQPATP